MFKLVSLAISAFTLHQLLKLRKETIEVTFKPVELRAEGATLRSVMAVDSYRLINLDLKPEDRLFGGGGATGTHVTPEQVQQVASRCTQKTNLR